MKGLIVALQFLTRLPTPRVKADEASFAGSMRWFPGAGVAVGVVVALAFWTGGLVDPWLGALAGLCGWVWVTGALHLDGLCDLADANGAAHGNRERFLAVLADPHVGSFGAAAIGLQLLAKLVLLHLLPLEQWPALIAIAAIARIGPLAWTRWLPPLHRGLGARFAGAIRPIHIVAWGAAWLGVCWFAPALLIAPILIGGWWLWLRRSLGGVSGDCHGAGIELLETGLLAVIVIGTKLA